MLAVLGAVAVQTEGLVGHELAGAGVDGSTDGDTKDQTERDQLRGNSLQSAQTLRDSVGALVFLRSRKSERPGGLHAQNTSREHGEWL